MAQKAGYNGIKKFSEQFIYTTEGSLSINVENDPDSGGDLPISGDAAKELAERISSNTQLISDTVGWESINELPQPFTASGSKLGLTYVNNGDSFTLSGTSTNTSNSNFNVRSAFILKAGTYILSGDVGNDNVYFSLRKMGDGSVIINGNGEFTLSEDTEVRFAMLVKANTVLSEVLTYYPMIRKSIYTNSTFVPYHPSVEECKVDNSVIALVENGATCQNPNGYAIGQHFQHDGGFCTATTTIAYGEAFTENTNFVKGDVASLLASKTIAVTPVSNVAFDTSVTACKRYGNVCILNIKIDNITQGADVNAQIGSIASDFPAFNVSNIVLTNGADTIAYLRVTSSGGIWLRSLSGLSNVTLYGEIMWIL